MNTLTPLFNRENQLPSDGWFHLVPRGEFPNVTDDGRKVMQVLDDAAFDAMLKNFAPKLLIDQEHFSHDTGKSSEAFGWIVELQKRNDGVWGRVEWTDLGDTAIKNRRYRFISPTWTRLQKVDAERMRPLHILDAGLTNQPNLRGMIPLSNREGQEFRRNDPADSNSNNNHNKAPMKQIAALLGLAAEASEDSILTAVTALKNRAAEAETKLGTITIENTELKNRVATQDEEAIDAELDARNVEDAKRTKLKPVLKAMKNRDERVSFLNDVIGEPAEATAGATAQEVTTQTGKPVLNRGAAGTPNPRGSKPAANPQEVAQKIEAEVQDYKLKNRCTYEQAHNAVRLQKPELFGVAHK